MKTLLIIAITTIIGLQNSRPQPGATISAASNGAIVTSRASELQPRAVEDKTTFATIDITIDPLGQPLGAFQFELSTADAPFTVVGVEAGDHPAFDHGRPPYFDRVAMRQKIDRLIVAEYARPNLDTDALPTGAARVATVHVAFIEPINPADPPKIDLTLTAVGNANGEPIDADSSFALETPERPQ